MQSQCRHKFNLHNAGGSMQVVLGIQSNYSFILIRDVRNID